MSTETDVEKKELRSQWQAEVDVHEYSAKEVAQHNTKADCWITVHGKVYDVTNYSRDHPGGAEAIYEVAGQDATSIFEDTGHSEDAREIMHGYLVGVLKGASAQSGSQKVKVIRRDEDPAPQGHMAVLHNTAFVAASLGAVGLAFLIPATFHRSGLHLDSIPGVHALSSVVGGGPGGFIKGFVAATVASSVVMFMVARSVIRSFDVIDAKAAAFKLPAHVKVTRRPPRHTPAGFLRPRDYQTLELVKKEELSGDSARYTFALPKDQPVIGLPTGQHVAMRAHLDDGTVVSRSYTPTSNNSDLGRLELVIKSYADGLLTGRYVSRLQVGDEVEFRGPKGAMKYRRGYAAHIGMVAGGTGITPLYQIIRAACEDDFDTTRISLVYANRTEADILLRTELDALAAAYPDLLRIHYVLDQPSESSSWTGGRGRITRQTLQDMLPAPGGEATKFLLCGPPGLVNATKANLVELGCRAPGAVSKMSDDIFCF